MSAGDSPLAKVAQTVVAVGGVVLAFGYLLGATILFAKLYLLRLPTVSVVGALPREGSIAQGISLAIAPAVIVAVVYAIVRSSVFPGTTSPPSYRIWSEARGDGNSYTLWRGTLGAGVVLLCAFPTWHLFHVAGHEGYRTDEKLVALGAIVLIMVPAMLGYMHGRARIAGHWSGAHGRPWTSPASVALEAGLVAAVVSLGFAAFNAVGGLPRAVVCVKQSAEVDASPVPGRLVGQTSDRVYLGIPAEQPTPDTAGTSTALLRTFSGDGVDRVVVSTDDLAEPTKACPKPVATAPKPTTTTVVLDPSLAEGVARLERLWRARHAAHLAAWRLHHPKG
jgi:hypothetical protein